MTRIAILLACYNRRQQTVSCLNALFWQTLPSEATMDVYLTDDGSTDQTAETITMLFPTVKLFKGDGSLFWAGGMRNSWYQALQGDYDYYLLLNDDTVLRAHALEDILRWAEINKGSAICVGSTMDREKNVVSYGGRKLLSRRKEKSCNVFSMTQPMECDMANANIMMVPAKVVKAIGVLDDHYTHGIADYDYTLRAGKAGFKTIVTPGFAGYCHDDHGNNWMAAGTSLKDRIKYLKSPKGLAYKEYLHFIRKHFPAYLPEAFLKLWIKTIFPVLWDKFKLQPA